MASMLQLRQRISARLDQDLVTDGVDDDIPATNVFWPYAQVNDWINQIYLEMYGEISEIETPTVVLEADGTYPSARSESVRTILTLTDDPLVIEEVRNVTGTSATGLGTLLPYRPAQERRQASFSAGQGIRGGTGSRTSWTWYGHNPMRIAIYPVPSSALTLRIRYVPSVPPELGSGDFKTDVPVAIPTAHHGTIVSGVVYLAKLKEEDPSWRDDFAEYTQRLERMREGVENRQAQQGRMPHITDPAERTGWLSGSGTP